MEGAMSADAYVLEVAAGLILCIVLLCAAWRWEARREQRVDAEAGLRTVLKSVVQGWHPDEARLAALAVDNVRGVECLMMLDHLVLCEVCRDIYAVVKEDADDENGPPTKGGMQ
jgi:hypothetical protein